MKGVWNSQKTVRKIVILRDTTVSPWEGGEGEGVC